MGNKLCRDIFCPPTGKGQCHLPQPSLSVRSGSKLLKRQKTTISTGERLSTVQSDRLYRIARIIALAVNVFKDKETALEWLNKIQPGLDSRTPLDMLQTAPETAEVGDLLYRLRNPSKHVAEIIEP